MEKPKLSWSGIALISGIILSSCMPEVEMPLASETTNASVESAEAITGGENFRKSPNGVFYQEKFSNEIGFVPDEGWEVGLPAPGWYPGTGVGNATHMGKGYSFINQYATFDPTTGLYTVGAPVTQFFTTELAELGLTDIPDEVNSLTTDGKGNAIFFKNILNETTPESAVRINFVAEVEIIGGTGIYKTASGSGEVNGFFNPENGKGESTLRANIVF